MTRPRPSSRAAAGLGILIGLLSIGAMDGWPFGPNLETRKAALGLFDQDLVLLVLLFVLVLLAGRTLFRGLLEGRAQRALTMWAMVLVGWWLYTVLRTWLDTQVPLRHDVFFGRDFVYYPLLAVLMADALKDRRLRHWAIGTFTVSALLAGLLQTAAATGHASFDGVVHAQAITPMGSFTRIYASSSDAVLVALFVCLGLVLLSRAPSMRRWMLPGVLIAIVSVLAELTRAKYLGCSIGILGAAVLWFLPRGAHRRRGSAGLLSIVALAVVVAVVLVAAGPTILGGAGQSISHRLASSISTALSPGAAGSTTATRENELSTIEQIIGSHTVLGLGFLDPRNVYFAQTRGGSIRNSDLGLFNVVATMGIVGTAIYLLAVVSVPLALILRHVRHRLPVDDQWLAFAIVGWAIAVAVSSVTLVTMFSPTGVVSVALMLGCGVALLDPEPQTADVTAALPRSVQVLQATAPEIVA